MLEAAIAVGAIFFFWIVATIAFSKKLSVKRRVFLILLAAGLVYLFIRLIHWAWGTTLPFVGG